MSTKALHQAACALRTSASVMARLTTVADAAPLKASRLKAADTSKRFFMTEGLQKVNKHEQE
jgi:hypothetical protein